MRTTRIAAMAAAAALTAPVVSELRVKRAARPLTDRWRRVPVQPRGQTPLGICFRPRQAETMGLDSESALKTLLEYPFQLIRLAAYWDELEPAPGEFRPDGLDRQIDAAEQAGKQIILCVGAVKAFGYPEFFVPARRLAEPLPEGRLIGRPDHAALLTAATEFIGRVVRRYRDRQSIIAWQVEHDATDPLGMEHSWRLSAAFVREEVDAVRAADPTRPVMLNGFLPTSLAVQAQQWWRTRDQGDSLVVAEKLADIVGIDFYPRHAVTAFGSWSAYLDGSRSPWRQGRRRRLLRSGRKVMVCEGQAEPWEAITNPPNPKNQGMYSCLPEDVIKNYNQCLRWGGALTGYLFWGAEYWLLRERDGDPRYLRAFNRVLENS
jgi:hypothetical protein